MDHQLARGGLTPVALLSMVSVLMVALSACSPSQNMRLVNDVAASLDPAGLGRVVYDQQTDSIDTSYRRIAVVIEGLPDRVQRSIDGRAISLGYGKPTSLQGPPSEPTTYFWETPLGVGVRAQYYPAGRIPPNGPAAPSGSTVLYLRLDT